MPNFQKSKGFQLRSGNEAKAPFKMMGSSPAKGGFMDALNAFKGESKTKNLKAKEVKTTNTTKPQANTNKPGSKNYKGTDKNTDKSHLSTKTTDKKGEVKTKAFKNDASEPSKPKPELSAAEKAAKKEKFAQGMRDAGELISNIGSKKSMSSVIQGQADRKQNRVDKNIQNEKDKVSTARNKQIIDQHNKEASGETDLSGDDSQATTSIKGTSANDLSRNKI